MGARCPHLGFGSCFWRHPRVDGSAPGVHLPGTLYAMFPPNQWLTGGPLVRPIAKSVAPVLNMIRYVGHIVATSLTP